MAQIKTLCLDGFRPDDYKEAAANPCIFCGKEIKAPKYAVHLLTNGYIVNVLEPFDEKEDQGFFPIGSDCKRRIPKSFVFEHVD